jgi:hypothetical protein
MRIASSVPRGCLANGLRAQLIVTSNPANNNVGNMRKPAKASWM